LCCNRNLPDFFNRGDMLIVILRTCIVASHSRSFQQSSGTWYICRPAIWTAMRPNVPRIGTPDLGPRTPHSNDLSINQMCCQATDIAFLSLHENRLYRKKNAPSVRMLKQPRPAQNAKHARQGSFLYFH